MNWILNLRVGDTKGIKDSDMSEFDSFCKKHGIEYIVDGTSSNPENFIGIKITKTTPFYGDDC